MRGCPLHCHSPQIHQTMFGEEGGKGGHNFVAFLAAVVRVNPPVFIKALHRAGQFLGPFRTKNGRPRPLGPSLSRNIAKRFSTAGPWLGPSPTL